MELSIIIHVYGYSQKLGDVTLKVAKSIHGLLTICV